MADTKISALTADASPTTDDLLVSVNDPAGTPANRKVTMGNLATFVASTGIALTDLPAAGGTPDADDGLAGQEDGVAVQFTRAQVLGANLAAIAAQTTAADKLTYWTGAGTAALADFTAAGRALVDDASASAQRTTLGLGTMALETAANYALLAGATFTGDVNVSGTGKATLVATNGFIEYRIAAADTNASVYLGNTTFTLPGVYFGPTNATTDASIVRSAANQLTILGTAGVLINAGSFFQGRINPRSSTTAAPGATPTIATDTLDYVEYTGMSAAITGITVTGTPVRGQKLIIAFTDNGTARALALGSSFEASGNQALPTTTVINQKLTAGFIWNVATSKWTCVAVA